MRVRVTLAALMASLLGISGLALAVDEEVTALPDGPGKDLVGKVCFECHGAGNFRKVRLDKDAWSDQVADMVDRGAKATEDQQAIIVEYLTRNFGKDSKINVNTAPLVEVKAVLGLSVKDSQAVLDYRETNGKFKKLEDLLKVPGIDGTKIEAKKDTIAF